MNFHEFMRSFEAKTTSNANNLFKQQFLMHHNEILCKMSVVDYPY
jgi:hypothetical protein